MRSRKWCLNPLLVAGKYSTATLAFNGEDTTSISWSLNPLLVAGKYSTISGTGVLTPTPNLPSQSPFSSGEVFHFSTLYSTIIPQPGECLNPLLVAGKYSTKRFASRSNHPRPCPTRCLNPLLVAGKYSTLVDENGFCIHERTETSQSPFSSGEVFHL